MHEEFHYSRTKWNKGLDKYLNVNLKELSAVIIHFYLSIDMDKLKKIAV